ncbi:MAG: a-glycosyltransferase, Glycosyltransferase Family 4-like protein [Myxococcaceae bacterium]|nr:a-glycosyltransferase, Glycosyltransferase Family 4-like protein [Myxococcaceae bacterium]
MRIVGFYHSLLSDWNHGNAHFLRGLVGELRARGHEVVVFEPRDGWSLRNLREELGPDALTGFHRAYPGLSSRFYDLETLSLDSALEGADLVLVHEWNEPELVRRIGQHRREGADYALLFHDTHHRMVTTPAEMERYELKHYDGVLAFGEVLRELYLARGVTDSAWTFHEAADTRVFQPIVAEREADLVWIGNWGDDERTQELHEFLLEPVHSLGLRASVYGVRYPEPARKALAASGLRYRGFLPNYRAPEVFARHAVTVHVPRRPYVRALVGVPTIRVFEALACGIPLVSAPWTDVEGLFRVGQDFLSASDGAAMEQQLRAVLHEPGLAESLREHGLETIRKRHTCGHRAEQLLEIARTLGARTRKSPTEVLTGADRCQAT